MGAFVLHARSRSGVSSRTAHESGAENSRRIEGADLSVGGSDEQLWRARKSLYRMPGRHRWGGVKQEGGPLDEILLFGHSEILSVVQVTKTGRCLRSTTRCPLPVWSCWSSSSPGTTATSTLIGCRLLSRHASDTTRRCGPLKMLPSRVRALWPSPAGREVQADIVALVDRLLHLDVRSQQ